LTSSIMPGETPEKGDKVSWPWNGAAPSGKVAETKEHGEISIQSKRGNTIKKNAEPDNPAVHVERSGNDVVKKASELNVEQKAPDSSSKKREHNDEEEEEPSTENAEVKDVKKQKTEKKSTKAEKKNTKAEEKKEKEVEKKEKEAEKQAEKKEVNGEKEAPKKKAGRPKGAGPSAAEKKKEAKPRAAEGIGSRTRSRA